MPAEGASALFQVIAQRYTKTSTIVTTNRPITSWGEILGDTTVAAALLDRLLHRSVVLTTKGTQTVFAGQGRWVVVVGLGWVEWRGALGFVV
ncbi:MAG TPA: ATP-binding protein, partial [Dermatophilaceae bacterium]